MKYSPRDIQWILKVGETFCLFEKQSPKMFKHRKMDSSVGKSRRIDTWKGKFIWLLCLFKSFPAVWSRFKKRNMKKLFRVLTKFYHHLSGASWGINSIFLSKINLISPTYRTTSVGSWRLLRDFPDSEVPKQYTKSESCVHFENCQCDTIKMDGEPWTGSRGIVLHAFLVFSHPCTKNHTKPRACLRRH